MRILPFLVTGVNIPGMVILPRTASIMLPSRITTSSPVIASVAMAAKGIGRFSMSTDITFSRINSVIRDPSIRPMRGNLISRK